MRSTYEIEAIVRSTLGTETQVRAAERLTGGSLHEIWSIDASVDGRQRGLILRESPPGVDSSNSAAVEAAVMEAAGAAGVPVPEVLAVLDDRRGISGLIMERVDGETVARRILQERRLDAARGGLATELGAALGRLHSMPLVAELPEEDRLTKYGQVMSELGHPRPVLEFAHRWLVENRPKARPSVVVHGDFRLGNLVVGEEGLRSVLDWESAHHGDPLEDLGWLLVPAWRFGGSQTVAGVGDVPDFLTSYVANGGAPVTDFELAWAIMLGTWVWAVGCLEQTERHCSGAQRSVVLASTGRLVVENEADLLDQLIACGGLTPGEVVGFSKEGDSLRVPRTDMPYGPPLLAELLDAVGDCLEAEIAPELTGRALFHVRVCVNSVRMAVRELEAGPVDLSVEAALLDAIRSVSRTGEASLTDPLLVWTVRLLDVTNPRRAAQLRARHLR